MSKKFLAILFIVVSLFSLIISVGVPVSASEFSVVSTVTPNIRPHQISIDNSSNGMTINLPFADNLIINLPSNASTGFEWQLDQFNSTVLQKVSNQYIPSPIIGGTGNEVWIFKPLSVGTSVIVMEYSQPWSGGTKAAQTFNLTVNVIATPVPASSDLAIGILVACLTAFIGWLTLKKLANPKYKNSLAR